MSPIPSLGLQFSPSSNGSVQWNEKREGKKFDSALKASEGHPGNGGYLMFHTNQALLEASLKDSWAGRHIVSERREAWKGVTSSEEAHGFSTPESPEPSSSRGSLHMAT